MNFLQAVRELQGKLALGVGVGLCVPERAVDLPEDQAAPAALGLPLAIEPLTLDHHLGEARTSSGAGTSPSLIVSFFEAKTPGSSRRVQPAARLPLKLTSVGMTW